MFQDEQIRSIYTNKLKHCFETNVKNRHFHMRNDKND